MKKSSYLIQRLEAPTDFINPFSFGGGYKNGGISDEFFKILKQIWSYDYMGSAEFEFGAIPKSFERLFKNSKNVSFGEVLVKAKCTNHRTNPPTIDSKDAKVFFVCYSNDVEEVKQRIINFADDVKHDFFTKEFVGLSESILQSKYRSETKGWHDIDNDFLFFIDEQMFNKFKSLFD